MSIVEIRSGFPSLKEVGNYTNYIAGKALIIFFLDRRVF
jgi:hypothetical protein